MKVAEGKLRNILKFRCRYESGLFEHIAVKKLYYPYFHI